MHISWHGMSCVKIQTSDAQLVINPFQDSGITMPKFKVDIVASSSMDNEQANNIDRLQGDPFTITNPGEYEVNNIFIYGVGGSSGETMYIVDAEGITLGHLGTAAAELTNEQLEMFDSVDVLFLPLHGANGKLLSSIASQIEARVIIPIQYNIPKAKAELDSIDAFAKEFGVKDTTGEKKIILKKKDLPVDEIRVHVLTVA